MLLRFRASFCRVNVCFLAYEMLPCFSDFSLLCKTRASLSLSLSLIRFLRKLCPGCCCYCLPRLVRAALTTNQCVSQPKTFLSYRKKKARKLSLYRSCYHYRQFSSVPESRLTKRSSLFSVFNSKGPRRIQRRRADLIVSPPVELLPSTPFHLLIVPLVSPSRAVFVQTCYRNHSVV